MEESNTPRIYVASLTDYNAAVLHGVWVDALDEDEIEQAVAAMLKASPMAKIEGQPAEEWAIHDYEGFHGLEISEYASFASVADFGACIAEHGAAFAAYTNRVGSEYVTIDGFVSAYAGRFDSVEDYAWQYLDDSGMLAELPEWVSEQAVVNAYAHELVVGGDIAAVNAGAPDYGFYIFSNG